MKKCIVLIAFLLIICSSMMAQKRTILPLFFENETSLGKDLSFRACAVGEGIAVVAGNKGKVFIAKQRNRKWKEIIIPDTQDLEFRDVVILSNKKILLMSAGEGSSSKIFRTTDSGKTWTCTHTNTFAKGFYDGFSFWDKENGVLMSDPIDEQLYLLQTSNGGQTWNRLESSELPTMNKGEYGFAASGTNIVAFGKGELRVATGGTTARVFRSSDYGKTWRIEETPIVQGSDSQGIFSIAYWNEKNAVAVGGDWKTEDSKGENVCIYKHKKGWQLQDVDSKQLKYASCVQYLDQKLSLIATGPAGTAYSTTGGEDWYYDAYVKGFHAVNYDAASRMGLLSGAGGRVQFFSMEENKLK